MAALVLLPASVSAMERAPGWQKLQGCQYQEGSHSDGDSVEVIHHSQHHVFRLYFVDCIELNPRSVARRRAQGHYFGLRTEEEAMRWARAAAEATRELLASKPFTVWTRWERVTPGSDNPSIRALIQTPCRRDLAEELVSRGLAIIRGGAALADHPDGRTRFEVLKTLRELETQARLDGRGAWSARRMAIPSSPPQNLRQPDDATHRVFSAEEAEALRAAAGRDVRVRGRLGVVSSLPDKRITFLNFEGVPRGGFVAIVRGGSLCALENALGGELPTRLTGRNVEIKGRLTLYKTIPQIELSEPAQLQILD